MRSPENVAHAARQVSVSARFADPTLTRLNFDGKTPWRRRNALRLLPAHCHHLAPYEGDLRRERQVLRADVVAGEQRHAAEHAVVVADHLVVIVVSARVARIEPEARHAIEADGSHEILAHARGAAGGHTAAAFDAAVELVDLVREVGIHPLLDPAQVRIRVLHVQPSLEPLAHPAHPLAGVDRQVADQLEERQRRQRDLGTEVLGERAAGERRPSVDHHRAAAADAGAADEVELQRRVLLLADLVQRDEQRHPVGFLEVVGLHARRPRGFLRVVAQRADLELAPRGARLVAGVPGGDDLDGGVGHFPDSRGSSIGSSMRSLRPRRRSGSNAS